MMVSPSLKHRLHRPPTVVPAFVGLLSLAGLAASAVGQTPSSGVTAPSNPPTPATASTGVPQKDTLLKLSRPITIEFTDKRLEEVIGFVAEFTGADIMPMWADAQNSDGLDREQTITLKANNSSALALLERVLERAQTGSQQNTWQLSDTGAVEIGPKDRLNAHRRTEIYDINDLLLVIPDYTDAPQIDLQQAIQASQGGGGGGGGGQSPFRDAQQQQQQRREEKEKIKKDRANEVLDIIKALVEPEQWTENGGSGGTIRYYQGTLIVQAPDYLHRELVGYPKYWPRNRAIAQNVGKGHRYVSLTTDTGISTLDGISQHPVTAVVGGQLIRSDKPGGGG
jgi:hypothetical protein